MDFSANSSPAIAIQEAVLKATAVPSPLQHRYSCQFFLVHQFFLVLLVFHQSCCLQGGILPRGAWAGGGGGELGGGGRGHFHPPAMFCTTTWCFALNGLHTMTWVCCQNIPQLFYTRSVHWDGPALAPVQFPFAKQHVQGGNCFVVAVHNAVLHQHTLLQTHQRFTTSVYTANC